MAVPVNLIEQAAERFRLLSDPTRLRLLNELDAHDELPVGDLAERTGVGLSNTSKHLHQLERDGIVARRRQGTTIYYRVADPSLAELCDLVCSGLRRRYAELAAQV
ncbi:MAG TPA: metalloregulator ArsR/SmtB family transcription factor [Gaiellaceae bacterium]|jgi:ArsR family transcriptional regulator|nr:metalloregulator ArsR/SmtB family transcription factor [Gaiellaceae bacterium]